MVVVGHGHALNNPSLLTFELARGESRRNYYQINQPFMPHSEPVKCGSWIDVHLHGMNKPIKYIHKYINVNFWCLIRVYDSLTIVHSSELFSRKMFSCTVEVCSINMDV